MTASVSNARDASLYRLTSLQSHVCYSMQVLLSNTLFQNGDGK